MHARSKHQGRYNFEALIAQTPKLSHYVRANSFGDLSIDFTNSHAVKCLNHALLKYFYKISYWDFPANYLCPGVPGRAEYIHHIADLFEKKNVHILDIGIGANCIYPIIGAREYGMTFVGSDTDDISLNSAKKIIDNNLNLSRFIELRKQESKQHIFKGIIKEQEKFDLTICNPPFHSSLKKAQEGSMRKWKNLGKKGVPSLNFKGQGSELWCRGGELAFILKMIKESVDFGNNCRYFSSLISKALNLPEIYNALDNVNAKNIKTIEIEQGNKKSRIVVWSI